MRIVVTGAGGTIGRAVADRLTRDGIEVIRVTRKFDPRFSDIVVDLAGSGHGLDSVIPTNPDAVVHLAAAIPNTGHYADTEETAAITRAMDQKVLQFCRRRSMPLYYASGCSLYDSEDARFKSEQSPIRSKSPYLAAKIDGEGGTLSLPGGCVMRISGPVGPGMRRSVVISKFVSSCRLRRVIEVWGNGKREQDFIDVDDIATFVSAAIGKRAIGIFNVASQAPVTMRVLAQMISGLSNHCAIEVGGRSDPNEAQMARFSIAKASRELGWRPLVSLEASLWKVMNDEFRD